MAGCLRYAALDAHPWMLALVNLSEPAMDTFLILCGFLAAHSLGPALASGQQPRQVQLTQTSTKHSSFQLQDWGLHAKPL